LIDGFVLSEMAERLNTHFCHECSDWLPTLVKVEFTLIRERLSL